MALSANEISRRFLNSFISRYTLRGHAKRELCGRVSNPWELASRKIFELDENFV